VFESSLKKKYEIIEISKNTYSYMWNFWAGLGVDSRIIKGLSRPARFSMGLADFTIVALPFLFHKIIISYKQYNNHNKGIHNCEYKRPGRINGWHVADACWFNFGLHLQARVLNYTRSNNLWLVACQLGQSSYSYLRHYEQNVAVSYKNLQKKQRQDLLDNSSWEPSLILQK
jgi:hypothetical protein